MTIISMSATGVATIKTSNSDLILAVYESIGQKAELQTYCGSIKEPGTDNELIYRRLHLGNTEEEALAEVREVADTLGYPEEWARVESTDGEGALKLQYEEIEDLEIENGELFREVEALKAQIADVSNSVLNFIDQECSIVDVVKETGGYNTFGALTKVELYEAYLQFTSRMGFTPVSIEQMHARVRWLFDEVHFVSVSGNTYVLGVAVKAANTTLA